MCQLLLLELQLDVGLVPRPGSQVLWLLQAEVEPGNMAIAQSLIYNTLDSAYLNLSPHTIWQQLISLAYLIFAGEWSKS